MLPCFLETYLDLKADRSLQNLDASSKSVPYLLPTLLTTASVSTLTSTFNGLKSLGAQLLLQPSPQGSERAGRRVPESWQTPELPSRISCYVRNVPWLCCPV